MADRTNARIVYSSDKGEVCPGCGWPVRGCKCSARMATAAVPARPIATLRMEKGGRGGKIVTVVDGLPNNAGFLKELCSELKRLCGTGGAVRGGAVELQGDLRDRIRGHLSAKGFRVKG
jgi:translation initiation factor 1